MKSGSITGMVKKVLGILSCEAFADIGQAPSRLGKADACVLKVAMSIAALDGSVTDAELAAFERLAKQCRGYSAESAKAVFRAGLRTAGYVELAARALSEKELLAVFAEEIERLLPYGFIFGNPAEVRRAFVMWIAMAMSDGTYSSIERKAISLFAKSVGDRQQTKLAKSASGSPAFVTAYGMRRSFEQYQTVSPAFLKEAESLIARLDRPSEAASAAADLKSLIQNG